MSKGLFLSVSLSLLALLSGCWAVYVAGGALGAIGTKEWLERAVIKDYPYPYDEVYQASKDALDKVNIKIINEQKDAITGKMLARRPNDQSVEILVENKGPSISKVAIVVGSFPSYDEGVAHSIHNHIAQCLSEKGKHKEHPRGKGK